MEDYQSPMSVVRSLAETSKTAGRQPARDGCHARVLGAIDFTRVNSRQAPIIKVHPVLCYVHALSLMF